MGALDPPRAGSPENGFVGRVRANPWLTVAIATGAVLVSAWIGWAIYVTGSKGVTEGLGVLIAWPAMLAALLIVSVPFVGGFLLTRRVLDGEDAFATADDETAGDEAGGPGDGEEVESAPG